MAYEFSAAEARHIAKRDKSDTALVIGKYALSFSRKSWEAIGSPSLAKFEIDVKNKALKLSAVEAKGTSIRPLFYGRSGNRIAVNFKAISQSLPHGSYKYIGGGIFEYDKPPQRKDPSK